MKTEREKIIDFACGLPQAVADKPFDDDFDTTVMRHGAGGKWFGIIMNVKKGRVGLEGEGCIDVLNVKCDPDEAFILRELYESIIPAYHMNKRLWISVILNGTVPLDFTERLVEKSYDLTLKKRAVSASAKENISKKQRETAEDDF